MTFRLLSLLVICTGLLGGAALAADRASPDEAKAMAIKAAQYLREVGPAAAFPAFSAKDGPWHDRDLYVFVSSDDHTVVAHGGMAALVGRTMTSLKDVDGNSISDKIHSVSDAGWIEYKWQNPNTKAIEPKASYVVTVDRYRVVVGAYK